MMKKNAPTHPLLGDDGDDDGEEADPEAEPDIDERTFVEAELEALAA